MLIPFGVFSAGVSGGDSGGGSFDLISTTLLTGSQASVTFDVTGLGATYKHLQIRYLARTDLVDTDDIVSLRFNSDSGSNYSRHSLYGSSGSVLSTASTLQTYAEAGRASAANTGTSIFSPGVIDILDAFSSTKNKTIRTLSAVHRSSPILNLNSNGWFSTAAIATILVNKSGTNFVSGSRFSLYGIKG